MVEDPYSELVVCSLRGAPVVCRSSRIGLLPMDHAAKLLKTHVDTPRSRVGVALKCRIAGTERWNPRRRGERTAPSDNVC